MRRVCICVGIIHVTCDMSHDRSHMAQGNESFKEQDYHQAAVFYTESLMLDAANHAVLSNRAACFLKLGQVCTKP